MNVITIEDCLAYRTELQEVRAYGFKESHYSARRKSLNFSPVCGRCYRIPAGCCKTIDVAPSFGLLFKKRSGKPFDEVLDRRVLTPLGMQRTTASLKFEDLGNGAKQYRAL